MMRRFVCLFVLVVLSACGPEEPPDPNNIIIDPNNGTNNLTTNNTNNTNNLPPLTNNAFGEACRGVSCESGRRCVQGVCVLEELRVSCEDFEDLGVAAFGEVYMGSGDTEGYADAIEATCTPSESGFTGPENAIRFEVAEAGNARFEVTGTGSVEFLIEVRRDCGDPGEVFMGPPNSLENNDDPNPQETICTAVPRVGFGVEPGREYWLIVEARQGFDPGPFDWELSLTQDFCDQGRTCQDGTTILDCVAGNEEVTLGCGTACTDGVCQGDSCADAIEVTASMSWSGDARAFTNSINFADVPSCSIDGAEGYATPGPEIVLSLPGLTAGQLVTVDASMNDDNDNAIFVLQNCAAGMDCLAAQDLGDVLDWTVPADGDYFVVIDKFTNSEHPFNYTIDIQ